MNKNKTITFITGTGFSGSGCVLDWLREQDEVVVNPSRPFSYHYRKDGKIRKMNPLNLSLDLMLLETNEAKTKAIEKGITFFTHFISSQKSVKHRILQTIKDQHLLRQLKSLVRTGKFVDVKKQKQLNPEIKFKYPDWNDALRDRAYLQSLKSLLNSPEELKNTVASWLNDRVSVNGFEHIVMDKTFPKGNSKRANILLNVLPQAKILVVTRNIYDQLINAILVEESLKRNDKSALTLAFENRVESIINGSSYFTDLKRTFPNRVFATEFEHFVQQHKATAQSLSDVLGIPTKTEGYKNLDLSISKKNIGLREKEGELFEFINAKMPIDAAKLAVDQLNRK